MAVRLSRLIENWWNVMKRKITLMKINTKDQLKEIPDISYFIIRKERSIIVIQFTI